MKSCLARLASLATLFCLTAACDELRFKKEAGPQPLYTQSVEGLSWEEEPDTYFLDLSGESPSAQYHLYINDEPFGNGQISDLVDGKLKLPQGQVRAEIEGREFVFHIKKDTVITPETRHLYIKDEARGFSFHGGRLFLIDQEIELRGLAFNISVLEIVSLNSKILSFKSKASAGSPGTHGPQVTIDAKYASGDLKIEASGQEGGRGIRPQRNPFTHPRASGGRDGIEEERCNGHECNSISPVCVIKPRSGQPGRLLGKKGFPANDGLPGGDAGLVEVNIKNPKDFNLNVTAAPGEGGAPSAPGLGGLGQRGGPPGHCPTSCLCNVGEGQRAPEGLMGEAGTKGPVGERGRVCIRLSDVASEGCFGGEG